MVRLPRSLWTHAGFLRLWAAQTLSAFGSRITRTAIPIVAINVLAASPFSVAVLSAASFLPMAFAGLFAAGFVERQAKRPLMIAMDLCRAGLLVLIPLAAWSGALGFLLLLLVATLAGLATALFQNADTSFLPQLVGRDHVIEGNAKLQTTDSIAEIAGPGLAGALVDLLTAPVAILIDAATFLWSAFWLMRIRHVPAQAPLPSPHESPWAELRGDLSVGWRAVMGPKPLRVAFLALNIYYVSAGFFLTLYMLLTLREMGLSAAAVGLIIGVGGLGGLAGAFLSQRLAAALGFGPAIVLSLALSECGLLLLLLAAIGTEPRVPFLVAHQLLGDAGFVAFMVLVTSLRQGLVAERQIARANGLFQIAGGFVVPMCGLIAGVLAGWIGIKWASIIGIGSGLFAILPLLTPTLLRMKVLPAAQS